MSNNSKNIKIVVNILLMLILTTLKLCNIINWSWWWVLSPIWIPAIHHVLWLCAVYEIDSKERFRRK